MCKKWNKPKVPTKVGVHLEPEEGRWRLCGAVVRVRRSKQLISATINPDTFKLGGSSLQQRNVKVLWYLHVRKLPAALTSQLLYKTIRLDPQTIHQASS